MRRECGEIEQFFTALRDLPVDGIMVGNLGTLKLARSLTTLPVQADHSFNIFNHLAVSFLRENGLTMATASYELSFRQLRDIAENAVLPIEAVVHGSYESMICDYNFPAMSLPAYSELSQPEVMDRHYAFRNEAGGVHSIRIDQYGRNHIYFANDLCLYPYLKKFMGLGSLRIEAQDYSPALTGEIVHIYRAALDRLATGADGYEDADFHRLKELSPRPLGIGTYRFRQSRNSI